MNTVLGNKDVTATFWFAFVDWCAIPFSLNLSRISWSTNY